MKKTATSRKQAYVDFLREGEELISNERMLQRILRPNIPVGGSGRAPDFMMHLEWVLYQATGDARHATVAHRMLTGDRERWSTADTYHRTTEVLDEFCHWPYAWTYCQLRDAGMLTGAESEAALAFLTQSLRFWQEHPTFHAGAAELDVSNLGITPAIGADFAARHIYEGDHATRLRQFADNVWAGYWRWGDCPEDATNYENLHYTFLPIWADLRGEREAMQAYVRNGAYERALQQVLPMGALLDQGDTMWQSGWAGWIAAFEMGAALTGDGRFAWAAQRLFDYARAGGFLERARQVVAHDAVAADRFTWNLISTYVMDLYFLGLAQQWCDERVVPRQPEGHATSITYRHKVALPYVVYEGSPAMTVFPHERGERHEDKVVLRGGYDRDANCIIASLDRKVHHDHEDAGAILSWTQRGSVLLKGPGYHQRQMQAHNLVFCAPAEADLKDAIEKIYSLRYQQHGENRCSLTCVEDFREVAMVGWQSVEYCKRPVTWRRTVVAPRDGAFLAVYDEMENRGDDLRVAPLWHTETVHAQADWWADCGIEHLSMRSRHYWKHNPRGLLVSFPLQEGPLQFVTQSNPDSEVNPVRAAEELLGWRERSCLYQSKLLPKGGAVSFLSVLVPHSPDRTGQDVAARVRVVAREKDAWCVEVADETGLGRRLVGMVSPRHKRVIYVPRPDHTGYLPEWASREVPADVHGDRSTWFTAGDVTTDAELFYVRHDGDRAYVAARRMRAFEMGGLCHHAQISPTRAPTRLQVNAEFDLAPDEGRARYWSRYLNPIQLSFGFAPGAVEVASGMNGIDTTAELDGQTLNVSLNGVGTIVARA